jgi:hypothetical protein
VKLCGVFEGFVEDKAMRGCSEGYIGEKTSGSRLQNAFRGSESVPILKMTPLTKYGFPWKGE